MAQVRRLQRTGVSKGDEAPRNELQQKTITTPKNKETSRGNGRAGTVAKELPGRIWSEAEILPEE